MNEWLWPLLVCAEAALFFGYYALFLLRHDVRLRFATLGGIVLVGIVGHAGIVATNWADHTSTSLVALLTHLSVMTVFFSIRRAYLIRARRDAVRAEIDEACRRLFIAQQSSQGVLLLSARGMTIAMQLMAMGSLTLVLFPRTPTGNKLSLLIDWLSRRYPGPIPRIRVTLNRR